MRWEGKRREWLRYPRASPIKIIITNQTFICEEKRRERWKVCVLRSFLFSVFLFFTYPIHTTSEPIELQRECHYRGDKKQKSDRRKDNKGNRDGIRVFDPFEWARICGKRWRHEEKRRSILLVFFLFELSSFFPQSVSLLYYLLPYRQLGTRRWNQILWSDTVSH